jgi:hypothetical protein
VKVRQAGRVVSMAVTVAVGVNTDGRREVLGMGIGPSEAETFWTEFLRKLARRGLRGVKLVISDAHEGLMAAAARVLSATHQRCRVHFARNALAHAGKNGRRVVSALMATAFAQDDAEAAKAQWRRVSDQLRPKLRHRSCPGRGPAWRPPRSGWGILRGHRGNGGRGGIGARHLLVADPGRHDSADGAGGDREGHGLHVRAR